MDERNSSSSGLSGRNEPGGIGSASGTSDFGQQHEGQQSGIVGKVRERAAAQINTQKDRATDGLGSVAQAVRETTQHLREKQHDTVAQYVEQAADQIERLSQNLKNKDVGELVSDAQRLARRQPALFVGGAFALGLVGARFFKSSPSDEADSYDRPDYGGYGSGSLRGSRGSGEYARADWRQPTAPGGYSGSATGGYAGSTGAGSSGATEAAGPSSRTSRTDVTGPSTTGSGTRRGTGVSGSGTGSPSRNTPDTERF